MQLTTQSRETVHMLLSIVIPSPLLSLLVPSGGWVKLSLLLLLLLLLSCLMQLLLLLLLGSSLLLLLLMLLLLLLMLLLLLLMLLLYTHVALLQLAVGLWKTSAASAANAAAAS